MSFDREQITIEDILTHTSTAPYTTSLQPDTMLDTMIQAVVDARMSPQTLRSRSAGSQICGPPPGLRLHARLPCYVQHVGLNVKVRLVRIYYQEIVALISFDIENPSFVVNLPSQRIFSITHFS